MPAEAAADIGGVHNLGPQRVGEAGLGLPDGRDVDADAAHAPFVPAREFLVARVCFVEMNDAATYRRIKLGHGVEHARIVEAVRARLHEHEAREAEAARSAEKRVERRRGGLVTQVVGDVRVFSRRSENVEMGIAGVRGCDERGREAVIGMWVHCVGIVSLSRNVIVKMTPLR